MSKLIPLWENVVVQVLAQDPVSSSGIILPDSKDKPAFGTVVAVGEWKLLDNGTRAPLSVWVGDIVYFTKYSPDEIEVDQQTYLVIKASSILAKKWV